MEKRKQAVDIFREGYNCAQAVVIAFHEECGMTKEMAMNISAPFGGGIGRQREVCGAVSGMCMVLGAMTEFNSQDKQSSRGDLYATTQQLCAKFKECHGSIVCREILKPGASTNPTPAERTAEYYAQRPCEKCVEDAALIIDNYLSSLK